VKLIDVLLHKNGHDTASLKEKETVQRRLNEVERKITQGKQADVREGLRSG
jgi:hypothetical protein